jgi:hypothetical protein
MSAPIKAQDSVPERLSKLLPADITAAFLSAKAGIVTYIKDPIPQSGPVFWTFVAILFIAPFYFRHVTKVRNLAHLIFLCASFVVFALSIATTQFVTYLSSVHWGIDGTDMTLNVIAIVLPILWVFLVANIFLSMLGNKVEDTNA